MALESDLKLVQGVFTRDELEVGLGNDDVVAVHRAGDLLTISTVA